MPTKDDLWQRQALPLNAKILMSNMRIREWYDYFEGQVYISFSGGKDSTVTADLVHKLYPDVPLVFADTGLEYPEVRAFAKKMGAEFVRPKMRFDEVISEYGYPIISKENAEAIYYARRIRNGEREREFKTAEQKRQELHSAKQSASAGRLQERESNPAESGYGEKEYSDGRERESAQERQWKDRRTFAGVGGYEKGRSIYNKEKWLPLCRDTAFKISHKCCQVMKKSPIKKYQRQSKRYPYLGTLAEESKLREQKWMLHGCNAFDAVNKVSQPLSFWTEQDILRYISREGLEIASVYGDIVETADNQGECKLRCSGCQRTGCVFCGFGLHLEKKEETRFQRLARTHPKMYEYCLGGGQWVDNPDYDPTAPKYDNGWENWNPKQIWVPSKKGLGMKYVFDQCNQIYGKDFIRYEYSWEQEKHETKSDWLERLLL